MKLKSQSVYDYLKSYSDVSFTEKPFCKEDSVVFCLLSYVYFERLIITKPMALKDVGSGFKTLNVGSIECRRNPKFYELLCKTKRFKDILIDELAGVEDDATNTQFGAITFYLDDGNTVVAYRGTTLAVSGWLEDLTLCAGVMTGCQRLGTEYLTKIASKTTGKIYVCGHSKGGNTALYASAYVSQEIKDRIEKIYDLDGPGFKENVFVEQEFKDIESKIVKILTKHDLIGSLLTTYKKYIVVNSRKFSVLEHDLYNWMFKEGELDIIKGLATSAVRNNAIINNWVNSLSDQERNDFIEFVADVVHNNDVKTFKELLTSPATVLKLGKYIAKIEDKERRENATKVVKLLLKEFLGGLIKRPKASEAESA